MATSISTKEIWRIALPIMLGNLAQTIITFTDTAFLGHLGVVALGASMIAGLYYFVFTTLAMGFAIGIQIIVARRFGERKFERIGVIFEHGSIFIFGLGALLFLILYTLSPFILSHIVESPNIYNGAIEYMNYRQFGIIFVCFNYLYRSLYIGISNTKVITYTTIIMAVVNIILDYGLIFGRMGLPEMGIGGAALASFCAEISATIFFTVYSYITLRDKGFGMFRLYNLEGELIGRILKIAIPTMAQKLFSFGAWFIFFILIEKMGELAIGISSIVRSLYMLLFIPVVGFCSTANTVTSRIIGEGRHEEVLSTSYKIMINCILCCLPLALLFSIFPTTAAQIYTSDVSLIQAVIPALLVVCGAIFTQAFGSVLFETVSGTGNTNAALYLEFGILVLYILFIWVMTNLVEQVEWVWTAEFIYGILIGIVSLLYLKFANWQKKNV